MIKLTQTQIDAIFASAKHQSDYFFSLYRYAFPDWDNIKYISGYPKMNESSLRYIHIKAIECDKVLHPDVLAGGLWINQGFAYDNSIPDWFIDTSDCQIEYK